MNIECGIGRGLGSIKVEEKSPLLYVNSDLSMCMETEREEWVLKELVKNELRKQQDDYGEKYNSVYEAESFISIELEEVVEALNNAQEILYSDLHQAVRDENTDSFYQSSIEMRDVCIKTALRLLKTAGACTKEIDS